MLEVCEDQQCPPQVFFLATTYLDTFLSRTSIRKNQFQLLASVCILLASKFSCVVPVTTDQLVIYTDNSVTKYKFLLAKDSVIAGAALAAAVKDDLRNSEDV